MNITTIEVTEYLSGLYRPLSVEMAEFRKNCEERHIPILLRDAEELILNYIRLMKPNNILEIGTAVGYSSICFAMTEEKVHVTTLELRESSYKEAKTNIVGFDMQNRIDVILGDARDSLIILEEEIKSGLRVSFDMIFIDAAKGHYMEFWDKAVKILSPNAIVISDNVLYKAITASDKFLQSRRNGTIMRRMREYLTFITNLDNVRTCVLPVGDGLAISQFL